MVKLICQIPLRVSPPLISNDTEVFEKPIPRTKDPSHCAVTFEASENRIVHESSYCFCYECVRKYEHERRKIIFQARQ